MSGLRVGVVVCALVAAAVFGMVHRALTGARVPRRAVTGRAAAAVGDSAVFASPIVPPGLRPVIPHADAESAAVAMAYFQAPSYQVLGLPYYKERPTVRRHFCGRTYYVRSVVALPDSVLLASVISDFLMKTRPAWVVPVCDDAGFVRTSVILADEPTRLRVIQGDQPGDVPELVFPEHSRDDPFPRIVGWDARNFPNWERGIGMTPETAAAAAASQLAVIGARVSEVPEAFTLVLPPLDSSLHPMSYQPMLQTHNCSRWRLTLDRSVMLRGITSGQVVQTRTVYVARSNAGCGGPPILEIPLSNQPATLAFSFFLPRAPLPPEMRSITLTAMQPIWFEEARLRP